MLRFLLFLSLFYSAPGLCLKNPEAERSHALASEERGSSTVFLLAYTPQGHSFCSSGALLDPWTILTCAHGFEDCAENPDTRLLFSRTPHASMDMDNIRMYGTSEFKIHLYAPERKKKALEELEGKDLFSGLISEFQKCFDMDLEGMDIRDVFYDPFTPKVLQNKDLAIIKLKDALEKPEGGFGKLYQGELKDMQDTLCTSYGYCLYQDDPTLAARRFALQHPFSFHEKTLHLYTSKKLPEGKIALYVREDPLSSLAAFPLPGMSGGPLMNPQGEIVGVVTRAISNPGQRFLTECRRLSEPDSGFPDAYKLGMQGFAMPIQEKIKGKMLPTAFLAEPLTPKRRQWIQPLMGKP